MSFGTLDPGPKADKLFKIAEDVNGAVQKEKRAKAKWREVLFYGDLKNGLRAGFLVLHKISRLLSGRFHQCLVCHQS